MHFPKLKCIEVVSVKHFSAGYTTSTCLVLCLNPQFYLNPWNLLDFILLFSLILHLLIVVQGIVLEILKKWIWLQNFMLLHRTQLQLYPCYKRLSNGRTTQTLILFNKYLYLIRDLILFCFVFLINLTFNEILYCIRKQTPTKCVSCEALSLSQSLLSLQGYQLFKYQSTDNYCINHLNE